MMPLATRTAVRTARIFVLLSGVVCSLAATGGSIAADAGGLQSAATVKDAKAVRQSVHILRLELKAKADRTGYAPDDDAKFEIALMDTSTSPAKAPKDFTIEVEVRSEAGVPVRRKTVTLKKGDASKDFEIDLKKMNLDGIVEIVARHPELLDAGTFIYVKPAGATSTSRKPRAASKKSSQRRPSAPFKLFSSPRSHLPDGYAIVGVRFQDEVGPLASREADLTLDYTPKRRFLANGEDPASVLLVLAQPLAWDVEILLSTTAGTLTPNPVRISAGEHFGRTTLTSDEVGPAVVSVQTSTPAPSLTADRTLRVGFKQPVTDFELVVAPPLFTWIDRADISVRLLREGATVVTDEVRPVSFTVLEGRGVISPTSIEIKPGQLEGRATFLPYASGPVRIAAFTADFIPRDVQVSVTALPYLILLLSIAGGSVGGLIALWTTKGTHWWRVIIGLVAGFVIYWAFIFGLYSVLPRSVVLNPLSAFVLPVLGGWLGTGALSGVAKRLGLIA